MSIKQLKQGGDYTAFTQDGGAIECFPSVEDAIENTVAYWHENETPEAITIREPSGRTVATVCPIGSDALKVVRDNGDTMDWTHIHYVTVDGKIDHTFAYNNNVEYRFKI